MIDLPFEVDQRRSAAWRQLHIWMAAVLAIAILGSFLTFQGRQRRPLSAPIVHRSVVGFQYVTVTYRVFDDS